MQNPTEYNYLSNLFESNNFNTDIENFKVKYLIKRDKRTKLTEHFKLKNVSLYNSSQETVNEFYSNEDKEKYNIFINELKTIANKYYIEKYIDDLRYYVLGRGFDRYSVGKVTTNKDDFTINIIFPIGITKENYIKFWKHIEAGKRFAKNNYDNHKDIKFKKKDLIDFDLKLALYKNKFESYQLNEKEKKRKLGMDDSQIIRYIKEVKEWLKYLKS